jgi:hypothetical protein
LIPCVEVGLENQIKSPALAAARTGHPKYNYKARATRPVDKKSEEPTKGPALESASRTGHPKFNSKARATRPRVFFDGLAAVRVGDNVTGKWGYIDRTGRILVNPQFDAVSPFDHKFAVVRLGDDKTGEWGYINHIGKYFVNPQFDDAHGFTDDGLARVRLAGKWGYIRR